MGYFGRESHLNVFFILMHVTVVNYLQFTINESSIVIIFYICQRYLHRKLSFLNEIYKLKQIVNISITLVYDTKIQTLIKNIHYSIFNRWFNLKINNSYNWSLKIYLFHCSISFIYLLLFWTWYIPSLICFHSTSLNQTTVDFKKKYYLIKNVLLQ